jgi:CrcB protein
MRLALVIAGGGLGSMARYLVGLWVAERLGTGFPWGTLSINVAGSFLIGLMATLADEAGKIGAEPRVFLVVGVLGGFTTFSSFALESSRLVEGGDPLRSALYVNASLAFSGAAVVSGIALGRILA